MISKFRRESSLESLDYGGIMWEQKRESTSHGQVWA
jgi:hypothetical protein